MDTATFLLKRQELIGRMERRRVESPSRVQRGWGSWLLSAGTSAVTGLGSLESHGLVSSMLWAVVAPAVVGFMRNGRTSLVERLMKSLFSWVGSKTSSNT